MVALYIVRHGEAAPRPIGGSDADRELTSDGRIQIQSLARRLQDSGSPPRMIFHSPYRRAFQTAHILGKSLGAKLQSKDALVPESSPTLIVNQILGFEQDLMLVSHIPMVHGLVQTLSGGWVGFSTGTCVRIELPDGFTPFGHITDTF